MCPFFHNSDYTINKTAAGTPASLLPFIFYYPMLSSRTTSSALLRIISILHTFHFRHLTNKHRHPLFVLFLHGFQQQRQLIRPNQSDFVFSNNFPTATTADKNIFYELHHILTLAFHSALFFKISKACFIFAAISFLRSARKSS